MTYLESKTIFYSVDAKENKLLLKKKQVIKVGFILNDRQSLCPVSHRKKYFCLSLNHKMCFLNHLMFLKPFKNIHIPVD